MALAPIRLSTTNASIAVLASAALWGLFWVPVRYLTGLGIEGPWAIMLLNTPAMVLTLIWLLATFKTHRAYLKRSLLIGMTAGAAFALFGISLDLTSVVRATLLFYMMPIWATLIGMAWLGERSTWQRWAALALGLLGLSFLMIGSDGQSIGTGDVMAFASGWLWAISSALIKRGGEVPLTGMLNAQFLTVAAMALILAVTFGHASPPPAEAIRDVLPVSVLVSLFGMLPAILLIFWASQFLFPGRVGLLLMAEVVVALLTASIFLPDERLESVQWLAVVFILGAAVVELSGSGRSAAGDPARLGPSPDT